MKTNKLFLVLLLVAIAFRAQAQETATLIVDVTNINSNEGKLSVGLYQSEEQWLDKTFMGETVEINAGSSTAIFKDVPLGKYAISLYHDENDNGKLDMRFGFLPKENYACSNQAKGSFGPPKWKDAVFNITKSEQTITIKL